MFHTASCTMHAYKSFYIISACNLSILYILYCIYAYKFCAWDESFADFADGKPWMCKNFKHMRILDIYVYISQIYVYIYTLYQLN